MSILPTRPRSPGPSGVADVSRSAIDRWREPDSRLPERKPYRPRTLAPLSAALDAVAAAAPEAGLTQNLQAPVVVRAEPAAGTHYKVVRGDTLGGLAQKAYNDPSRADAILKANTTILGDPDRVYVGQMLYIP